MPISLFSSLPLYHHGAGASVLSVQLLLIVSIQIECIQFSLVHITRRFSSSKLR